ncbi:heavy metal translocating P-type ATPase [Meiothermus hypogaeus]|uniref:Heavy metal-(Cd/Co/Hg/Pb/Zn)-translocating P-type ATPase n=2 Tax=Meiothermus hypogaeus TaxID=884155 RepID=A0A511R509_9DEIN|nr:cation-translocating P-type ATPase [Meiothermus hypogaeus]RIH76356.1 Zinc-transporting ATPase [Meiothermus hypogaeus]GEM84106.1 heavy metal-(Cd/Co/Hg/Pb/Zn)-translocating P-type ATPase [Meiothermus hypogaeus NBRC 106114]
MSAIAASTSRPQNPWLLFWHHEVKRGFLLSGLTLLGVVGGFVAGAYEQVWLQNSLWTLAFLAGGVPSAIKAMRSLFQERKLDVDLLMVVAALGAASVGQAGDGAILLFLFSLSNTLQSWAMNRTRRAIEALMTLHPEGANVLLPDGSEQWKPLEALRPGDLLVVRPGERFAADGTVLEGYSDVDESALTGESVPVDKKPGDPVKSGTLNGHGVVRVRVERPASESTLAKLIKLVESAQASKSRTERFAERFEGPYTIAVLLSAPVVFAVAHFVFGLEAAQAWYRAMTFLVVASPCAVVIATPAAVLSAMAAGARAGALFKSGAALESLARANIFVFDKTGTLTEGRMKLVEVVPLQGSEAEARALAAGIERYSEHPIAQAIVQGWEGPTPEVSEIRAVRGHGVLGVLADGSQVWVGNRRLLESLGIALSPSVEAQMQALEDRGLTTAVLGTNHYPLALLGVADTPRPEAAQAIARLRQQGARVVMLTGDRKAVAHHIAVQVGITEVYAELLPEDKLARIQQLEQEGTVVMVGDGLNDAPALNAAAVGVSMAAGSDVSLESADLVLMKNDLNRLVGAQQLARATARTVYFNLSFALGVIVVVGAFALAGKVPLPMGVVAHEGGTVFVVLVGLRLLAHRVR